MSKEQLVPPLAGVFKFLNANHSWNVEFQMREYRRCLASCVSRRERLTALLSMSVNTQSQPKLSKLGCFWRAMHEMPVASARSLYAFTSYLESLLKNRSKRRGVGPLDRLFIALCAQDGWGKKTAALFVKSVINVHRGPPELHFWNDCGADRPLDVVDRIHLPVDRVIIHIFQQMKVSSSTFDGVNSLLMEHYGAEQLLVWDDLWFWGYFTQDSQDGARRMRWNADKFWCQLSSPVEHEDKVKDLCERFIALLRAA